MSRPAVALLLVLGAVACAGGTGDVGTRAPDGASLMRRIDPFPVTTAEGRPIALPFLGGFNVPRPQWVDLEGDGDPDLVVQELTNRLMLFERVGHDAAGPRHVFRPDGLGGLDVGEWYRFVDVDADGDPDLLAEEPFSYIRIYRNRGAGAHAPDFVVAADTLRDTDGRPIFADRQNIPNAGDLDCDGLLDLLIGRTTGTIMRYEATGPFTDAVVPRLRLVTDRFEGIEIVGTASPGIPNAPGGPGTRSNQGLGSRHGANTMALADFDADGDLDLFWGDFFEPGLLLIENTGSCADPDLTGTPRPFPIGEPVLTSGYNAPTFSDADGDGDLDLLMGVLGGAFNANVTTADNLYYFERGAAGGYELSTRRYLGQVDVGSETVPALLDIDGDGDRDLLLTNRLDPDSLQTSRVHVLERVDRGGSPAFRRAGTFPLAGAYHNAPAFGDLDGDGDEDLLLGTWRSELRYFRRDAGPAARFTLVDSAFVTLTRGSNATPALGDLDGDGDLDLLVGESSGALNYYRNTGGRNSPSFELVSDEWGGIRAERRSVPALADWDGDGDLDLLLGTEREGVLLHVNTGAPAEARFAPARVLLPPSEAPAYSTPLPADMDGDGDLDLILGGAGGGVSYYERME